MDIICNGSRGYCLRGTVGQVDVSSDMLSDNISALHCKSIYRCKDKEVEITKPENSSFVKLGFKVYHNSYLALGHFRRQQLIEIVQSI